MESAEFLKKVSEQKPVEGVVGSRIRKPLYQEYQLMPDKMYKSIDLSQDDGLRPVMKVDIRKIRK